VRVRKERGKNISKKHNTRKDTFCYPPREDPANLLETGSQRAGARRRKSGLKVEKYWPKRLSGLGEYASVDE